MMGFITQKSVLWAIYMSKFFKTNYSTAICSGIDLETKTTKCHKLLFFTNWFTQMQIFHLDT